MINKKNKRSWGTFLDPSIIAKVQAINDATGWPKWLITTEAISEYYDKVMKREHKKSV